MRQKNETDFSKAKNEEKQNECFLFAAKFCNLFKAILRIEILWKYEELFFQCVTFLRKKYPTLLIIFFATFCQPHLTFRTEKII